jgi:hypothetical protein
MVACVWIALVYSGNRESMLRYLNLVGFPNYPGLAGEEQPAYLIFSHSVSELLWGIIFIGVTLAAIWLVITGYFRGRRALLGFLLIGAILVFDLMRANAPWVLFYPYQERYASTPLYEVLSDGAHEHRVSKAVPLLGYQYDWGRPQLEEQQATSLGRMLQNLIQIYDVEWKQHQLPYFNIQSLDIIQEPRASAENVQYRSAFPETNLQLYLRMLRLTNTRYVIGLGDPFLTPLNQISGGASGEFRTVMHFGMEQSGDFIRPVESTNSPLALVEFTGALPRAKLYSSWEVIEDADAALNRVADLRFDPAATVIVSDSVPATPSPDTGPGTVEFVRYEPKHIELRASAQSNAVLLLNDKFDPYWEVLVDGEPAELLRANFLMRGVFLTPGEHTVEFHFRPPNAGLYVSLLAIAAGGGLCGWLGVARRRELRQQVK